jgi:hypothetical protein
MKKENKIKIEQFIGIFPDVITDEMCSEFVKWFDVVSKQGLTMSSRQDSTMGGGDRKDEVIHVPSGLSLGSECFSDRLTYPLWNNITNCLNLYSDEYNIVQSLSSSAFKMHRVRPTGGYHLWHQERGWFVPHRTLAWHLTLESPKSGGETEFLFQSMKIEPRVGQLLIWPAGFTHQHRGNPPLEGQKTYMTGWFDVEASEKVKYE